MDSKVLDKLKMHLTEAQACIDRLMGGEGEGEKTPSAAPEGDDGDMAANSLKMKFGKYK